MLLIEPNVERISIHLFCWLQSRLHAVTVATLLLCSVIIMLLLVCLNLGVLFTINECDSYEASRSPAWMYPTWSSQNESCKCGSSLHGAVYCNSRTSTVYLRELFCLFSMRSWIQLSLAPALMLSLMIHSQRIHADWRVHRRGQLCGACEENYTLPVYSYYLGCVKCEDYKYGWVRFIAAAFLPLTVMYIIVIIFRISATSSVLNGYVLISQLVANPINLYGLYTHSLVAHASFIQLIYS